MSQGTSIEWTDDSWNTVGGCSPVSPGCLNCYAAAFAGRGMHPQYVGLTVRKKAGEGKATRAVFNGTVRLMPEKLGEPLRWRRPRRVFVNSMSDLFHEKVPFEFMDRVFAVMALCPRHTFQVLTKRPERMAEYLRRVNAKHIGCAAREMVGRTMPGELGTDEAVDAFSNAGGVLPNVWLGTSVEDQARADERVPHLLRCPAAVRFLSVEPLLGAVDLMPRLSTGICNKCGYVGRCELKRGDMVHLKRTGAECAYSAAPAHGIGWVIVGGESGPGSRPCEVSSVHSIVEQCWAAGVACFVKQLGARPCVPIEEHTRANWGTAIDEVYPDTPVGTVPLRLRDRKGGDWNEWPEELRVREFPREAVVA